MLPEPDATILKGPGGITPPFCDGQNTHCPYIAVGVVPITGVEPSPVTAMETPGVVQRMVTLTYDPAAKMVLTVVPTVVTDGAIVARLTTGVSAPADVRTPLLNEPDVPTSATASVAADFVSRSASIWLLSSPASFVTLLTAKDRYSVPHAAVEKPERIDDASRAPVSVPEEKHPPILSSEYAPSVPDPVVR